MFLEWCESCGRATVLDYKSEQSLCALPRNSVDYWSVTAGVIVQDAQKRDSS